MANGTDKAKEYADQICPSNEDDGVAKTLQEYIH
jgi:hydroxymethylpyrimidine pyrophosphatase-like HAD family hydrolase